MQKILVVDGSSIIHRAFFGMRLLQTQSGKYTNAVYGTVSIIKRQMDALAPDVAAVAFDLRGPTFRHLMYPGYKEGRRPTPPELSAQFEDTKACLSMMGLHVLELEGWEADDIQGTVARMAADLPDAHAYILSGDRDLLQLIDERTTVLLASNHETEAYDADAFFGRFGIRPDQYVDAKALMGDASDRIPGVPGIGEKTALKLIALFGSLDGVYDALARLDTLDPERRKALPDGVCRKLTEGRDSALLSRDLARIRCDAPLGLTPDDLRTTPVDRTGLYRLFVELEFRSLLSKFRLSAPADDAPGSGGAAEANKAAAQTGADRS
ncbi:MAG: DNA polymerase I, partial [Clostridia bacterium]|nr:DNA polymerase I [Clostridia bacterium]